MSKSHSEIYQQHGSPSPQKPDCTRHILHTLQPNIKGTPLKLLRQEYYEYAPIKKQKHALSND